MVNVQHDCISARCTASGEREVMQERTVSGVVERCWEHKYSHSDRFVLNMHSLHNPHLLRRALRPRRRALTAPIPIYPDRWKQHCEQAERLRKVNNANREKARQKREETAAAQAAEKAAEKRKKAKPTAAGASVQDPVDMRGNSPPALASDSGERLDEANDDMVDEPMVMSSSGEPSSRHSIQALDVNGPSLASTSSAAPHQTELVYSSRERKRRRVE